jgi:hypothetical protein
MTKTINEIIVTDDNAFFTLSNSRNKAFFTIFKQTGLVSFRDAFGNMMQSDRCTITINETHSLELSEIGDAISVNDGTLFVRLSLIDVQELAEKTFYEEGQTRIYDFINQKFTIAI